MTVALAEILVRSLVESIRAASDLRREGLATKLRELADRIERGDIVPDEALETAQENQTKIDDFRDSLPDN